MRKMSRNAKVLTTLVVLVFAGAIAAAPDTAEDVLVGWLEDNDCSLTFDDYIDRSLSVEGFAPIDMKNAMDSMIEEGGLRRDVDGNLVLVSGNLCEGTAVAEPEILTGTPEQILVTIFEENGCDISPRTLIETAMAQGLTRADIDEAGEGLDDQGAFVNSEVGLQLVIGPVCG